MESLSFVDQVFHKVSILGTSQVNMQGAMIIDPGSSKQKYTAMALAEHIAARLNNAPILRKKLVQDLLKVGDIKLVDDPEFDMWNHITFSTLPSPGNEQALLRCLERFSAEPLDLRRPLWRFEIIEGLEGGKFAIAQKLSHATMDGMAAMSLAQCLFDTEPKKLDKFVPAKWQAEPEPTELQLLKAALSESKDRFVSQAPKVSAKAWLSAARAAVSSIHNYLGDDEELIPAAPKPKAPKPMRTSINQGISTDKRNIAYVTYEIDKLKGIGKALGYTLNDLCLAMASEAFSHYFKEIGEVIDDDLIFCMPMSTRDSSHKAHGNVLKPAIINTHTSIPALSKRLEAIYKQTGAAKDTRRKTADSNGVSFDEITAVVSPLVIDCVAVLLNQFIPRGIVQLPANTVMSNVPGPREAMYFAGMKIERSIPLQPVTHGVGLSVGASSMGNVITFGFHACGKCVRKRDMHFLTEGLDKAYAELCALAEQPNAESKKPARASTSIESSSAKVVKLEKTPTKKVVARKPKATVKSEPAQKPKIIRKKVKPSVEHTALSAQNPIAQ